MLEISTYSMEWFNRTERKTSKNCFEKRRSKKDLGSNAHYSAVSEASDFYVENCKVFIKFIDFPYFSIIT